MNSPSSGHQTRRETRAKRHLFQNADDDPLGPPASPSPPAASLQRKLTELGTRISLGAVTPNLVFFPASAAARIAGDDGEEVGDKGRESKRLKTAAV